MWGEVEWDGMGTMQGICMYVQGRANDDEADAVGEQ